MRVLVLSWRYLDHPAAGGAEVLTHQVLRRWAAAGHAVTCFTAAYPGARPTGRYQGVSLVRRGRAWTVHWLAWRWLRRRLDDYDLVIDQINTIPFLTPWYVPAAKRRFHVNQLAREYWWRETRGLFRLFAPLGYLLEPWLIRCYRNTNGVTISESSKRDLVASGIPAGRIRVIPMAITGPIPNRLPSVPGGPLTTVIVGRLTPAKFLEEALDVQDAVQAANPEARLWIAGGGDDRYRRRLQRQARARHLNVRWLGRVSEARKRQLLRAAHCYLLTSHREGWGLVVSEAAAQGTPSVGYDVPGVRDSISDRKLLAPVGDTAGLAERLLALWQDRSRYQRTRRIAWRRATALSYDATATQYLQAVT